MLFKAVFYGPDHRISIRWVDTSKVQNWFSHEHRSYFIDRAAICQVVEKEGQLKGIVEALYIEGNPVPLRSTVDPYEITITHRKELQSAATNKPQSGFWSKLLGR